MASESFVDIHCHLLPGIDDGARDLNESLAMARLAVADGISTVICTPHQGGNYCCNRGAVIRRAVAQLQTALEEAEIPLEVLPGADVRIDSDLVSQLMSGEIVSLGDHRRYVLLELPHELYLPLESLHANLKAVGVTGILSHPERNQGIMDRPDLVRPLVESGVLMQITAGSLVGTFGARIQKLSVDLLRKGLVHFISTDAHGVKKRRPLLYRAYQQAVELVGEDAARTICCRNPRAVAENQEISGGVQTTVGRGWRGLFSRRTAA